MKNNMRRRNMYISLMGVGTLFGAQPGLAVAADVGIEEVVVTAQKREETLQETPIALSVMTSEDLVSKGITDLAGVAQSVPSLVEASYPSSPTMLVLFMRGQGFTNPMEVTADTAVGLYQNGFFISRPQAVTFDLADVERVEVLRGPQGSLYGRNTTGGAVNIITRAPSGEFGFTQELTLGNFDHVRSRTTIDLPAWNSLTAKFSYVHSSTDGYVENSGGNDFGHKEQRAGRLDLRWLQSGAFTVDYFFETGTADYTALYFQNKSVQGVVPGYAIDRDKSYRPIDLPESNADFESHGLTLTWDVSDALTIKSLTGYRELTNRMYQDYAEVYFVPFASADDIDNHQFSQELQFIGDFPRQGLSYVAGLYYFEESTTHLQRIDTSDSIGGAPFIKSSEINAESKSRAIYAQLTWTPDILDKRLDVVVGARYTEDNRNASRDASSRVLLAPGTSMVVHEELGTKNRQNFERFNPSLTLSYAWSDDLETYAKVATGYKAGGSSEGAPPGRFGETYDPEDIVSYELGLKSYWWDRRIRLNMAAFHTVYEDMQLAFVIDSVDQSVIQAMNAGDSTIDGFELELLVQPLDGLSLSFDYTYLDSKMKKIAAPANTLFDPAIGAGSPFQVGENIADVFTLPLAPEHSYTVSADYTIWRRDAMDVAARIDYSWRDKTYTTAAAGSAIPGADLHAIDDYGVLNARLSFDFELRDGGRASVALWGKNITDRKYEAYTIGLGLPLPNVGYSSQPFAWAEPRTYGITLRYEY